jgi:hypothetical protein
MMVIHHTLQLLTTIYQNELAHIFTYCLISRTQTTALHKIKAHTNIGGNDQADALSKLRRELDHRDASSPYDHAQPTPYYLQKYLWHSMEETPNKGPMRHLSKHILKHDNEQNLTIIANQTHQLHKWLENDDIDKVLLNDFWTNPTITDKQKTCLMKFRIEQYIGHARKQLFVGKEFSPSRTYPICNLIDADTWLHILLKCKQPHIHALITKGHNKVVWEICKLIISNRIARHYTLMNARTHNEI